MADGAVLLRGFAKPVGELTLIAALRDDRRRRRRFATW